MLGEITDSKTKAEKVSGISVVPESLDLKKKKGIKKKKLIKVCVKVTESNLK